jgi:hypothetical protein
MWWSNATDPNLGNPSGTALGTFQTNTLWVGTNTSYTTINSTAFSGTANNTLYVGTVTAANVVSNAQLSANLANYPNNTNLSSNLSNYATLVGLSSNVAKLSANNTTYLNGQLASYYTTATNITSGQLPYAQLGPNVVNTTSSFTFSSPITFNANLIITGSSAIILGGSAGANGYVITSNGTYAYWTNLGALTTNVNSTYAWTNTQSWSNTVTFNGNVVFGSGTVTANGSTGTAGQALTSNSSGGVYWSSIGTNTAAQYTWSNTQTFSNTITFTGSINANTITVAANNFNLNQGLITSGTLLSATGGATVNLDSFSTTSYRAASYEISVNANGQIYQTSTVKIVQDGTNPYITEYGILSSNGSPLATFTASLGGGSVTLSANAVLSNTVFKYVKTMVNV